MAKQNLQWTVNVDGVDHHIEYKPGKLIVDGEKYKLKSSNWFVQLIDYAINFGNTTCRLVVVGNKVDLAVNGKFLGSGEAYEPIGNIPIVVTVFGAISVVLGFFMNSYLGVVIGAALAVLYFNMYLKKKSMGPVVIAFVIAIIGQIALGIIVSLLLAPVAA
ncbi:MAG: hypothetical protein NC121_10530 [Blautia sp.]|nr:hypothetical protein [Blautia sp.]